MCLIEVWTFSECGCRFDHHVPCHPSFSESTFTKARHGQIQPLPATPPPSLSADDGDYAWSSYAEWDGQDGTRLCSIRHIERRVFREPICDDCLFEELGLNKGSKIQESIENGIDGAEWLLESKVEIQIDQDGVADHQNGVNPEDLADDMPTAGIGKGFDSLGEGVVDDEGGFEDRFRGRCNRRSAIDINRAQLGMANCWSNWDTKPANERRQGESRGRKRTARSLIGRMKDTELKGLAEKAKRGLKLTIDRAKNTASKARSDTSWSPTKSGWGSESSGLCTPTLVTRTRSLGGLRGQRRADVPHVHDKRASAQGFAAISPGSLTALPDCQSTVGNDYQRIVSIPREQGEDNEASTPTSISSSAAFDIGQSSPTKWEDHLRQDLGEKVRKKAFTAPIARGNRSDLHFDADDEGRRFLSTDTSVQPPSSTSSGNWVPFPEDGQRLADELADDEHQRLFSIIPSTASAASSLAREVPTTTDMDGSIPLSARPLGHGHGHAHRPSTSSVTTFSPSPQTSPPRPSPRMRQNLSFHPLTTMLQIGTLGRPNWSARHSSFESPPVGSPCLFKTGGGVEEMQTSGISSICVHERDCCAICGCGMGGAEEIRVLSCVCEGDLNERLDQECRAEKPVVKMVDGMEVCEACCGQL
jgi:hypothetical protein